VIMAQWTERSWVQIPLHMQKNF